MTVRVEKLLPPAPSIFGLALIALASTTAGLFVRWWQRPGPLTMSDDWLNEHARQEAQQGWE